MAKSQRALALVIFLALDNKDAAQYDPTVVAALKNIWPIGVRACMVASATTAFVPILWSSLPNKPLPVQVIDSALQLPALIPALKIMFSGSLKSLVIPILATLNVLSYAAVTIITPAALVIVPMIPKPTTLSVPTVDLTLNSEQFAVMSENRRYLRPRSEFLLSLQETLSLRNVTPWTAPSGCTLGCEYNITYRSPAFKCTEYTPNVSLSESDPRVRVFYNATLRLSDIPPVFDVAIWPSSGSRFAPLSDALKVNMSPQGTRCTFHEGIHTANVKFVNGTGYLHVADTTILANDPLPNLPIRFLNNTSCRWDWGFFVDKPSERPACANSSYAELNTWIFIDSFTGLLSGTVYNTSESRSYGLRVDSTNPLLLSSLRSFIMSYERDSMLLYLPFLDDHKLALNRVLERAFARSAIALIFYGTYSEWNTEVEDAWAPPFANRYVYSRRILWFAYAGTLITAMIPALIGCYFVWKGFKLTEETTLAKILLATRNNSLNVMKRTSLKQVDDTVLEYHQRRSGNEREGGMEFWVVYDSERTAAPAEEKVHMLSKV